MSYYSDKLSVGSPGSTPRTTRLFFVPILCKPILGQIIVLMDTLTLLLGETATEASF